MCEVCGRAKHGAAYGHTKVLGYHPLVAVRSDTGEVLHSRMRSGSSQRGNVRFARETLARVRRLAAHAAVTVRADAGFFSYEMIAAIGAHNACYSITIPQNAKVKAAAEAIGEDAWQAIAYTRGGEAQVAESTIEAGRRGDKLRGPDAKPAKLRLVIRRSRLLGAQRELWPNWRYHCFVTDRHDLDTKPPTQTTAATPQSSSPSETSKKAPGSAAAPQDSSPPTAPGSPAACSRTTSCAGPPTSDAPTPRASSPSRPPSATGSSPCRAASSTTAAATDCACRSTGHGQTPSPPPWDTSATCPAHLSRPQRPAQRRPTPPATNPHQPHTPILHAPKRAGPHTRTSPAATRPQPPIPQTRRWIQAKRAGGGGSLPPLTRAAAEGQAASVRLRRGRVGLAMVQKLGGVGGRAAADGANAAALANPTDLVLLAVDAPTKPASSSGLRFAAHELNGGAAHQRTHGIRSAAASGMALAAWLRHGDGRLSWRSARPLGQETVR